MASQFCLATRCAWAEAASHGRQSDTCSEWDRDEWVEAREAALDADVGRRLGDEMALCPEAAIGVFEKRAGRQGRRILMEEWGAVEVCDDADTMLTLSCLMGENLTVDQIDQIAEMARTQAQMPIPF